MKHDTIIQCMSYYPSSSLGSLSTHTSHLHYHHEHSTFEFKIKSIKLSYGHIDGCDLWLLVTLNLSTNQDLSFVGHTWDKLP